MKQKLVLFVAALSLVLTAFGSAAAAPILTVETSDSYFHAKTASLAKDARLTIQNKTDGTLYFTFTGPHTYYITVAAHSKTATVMLPGKYSYHLTGRACGIAVDMTGKLQVKGNRSWTWKCQK